MLKFRFKVLHTPLLEVLVYLFAIYFVYTYLMTKYWVANNVIAIAFTVHSIENMLVGNFKHIVLISLGLIAYDVYFVFASDVMMTVASSVDLPLKLLLKAGGR